MSADPGGMGAAGNAADPVMDFDEESTLDQEEAFDPIDEADHTMDRQATLYDTSWVPPDRPPRQTNFGTALTEMREGESLDQRLGEEEPDVFEQELGEPLQQLDESYDARLATEADVEDPEVEQALEDAGGDTDFPAPEYAEQQPRAGRLVEPDEGLESDREKDMIAYDAGSAGAGASAEEPAVHIVEDAPGRTP